MTPTKEPFLFKQNLNPILTTHTQIIKIKTDLFKLIDTIEQSPSIITRFANFWSSLPLWQQISIGVVLSIPALLTGIFTKIAVITTLGALLLITHVAISYLLYNHHKYQSTNTDELKQGIGKLADLLGNLLKQLSALSKEFTNEINKLSLENKQLATTIAELTTKMQDLKQNIKVLHASNQYLLSSKTELEQVVTEINVLNEEQSNKLHLTKQEFALLKTEYEQQNTELTKRINELSSAMTQLGLEMESLKPINETLKKLGQEIILKAVKEEKHGNEFMHKLDDFVSNQKQALTEYFNCVNQASKNLSLIAEELAQNRKRHQGLLQEHSKLIVEQEQLVNRIGFFKAPKHQIQELEEYQQDFIFI